MKPKFTKLEYTYKKEESDVWVLNTEDIPLNMSQVHDQQTVHLAPGSAGGNHKHPRTEWFIAIGDLEIVWLDHEGKRNSRPMNPEGEIWLIEVPPFLPHAVRNTSQTQRAVLFEYADSKMTDVERITIV